MLEVSVGSLKPFKVESVRQLILREFETVRSQTVGVEVSSGVSDQPFSKEETIQGAVNRSIEALQNYSSANIGAGLEGGVFEEDGKFYVFDVAAITLGIEPPKTFTGESEIYLLPFEVVSYLKDGMQLSSAMHEYLKSQGQNVPIQEIMQNGTIYYLSDGVSSRDMAQNKALSSAMKKMDEFLASTD